MSITSKLICLTLLSAPVVGALSAPVLANVRSANSATVCQWEDAAVRTGGDGHYLASYSAQKGMYHSDHSDDGGHVYPVTCNIPRNLPLRTDGMSDLEVRFRSVDSQYGGTSTVVCTAYSYRSDGTLAAAATKSLVVDMNQTTTTVPLDFGSAIGVSGSKGFYVISCAMPTNVGLFSIYSSENDGIANN